MAAGLERAIGGAVSLETVASLQCEAGREGAVVAALRIAGKGEACRLSQHRLAECNLVDRETPQAELQGKVEKSAQFSAALVRFRFRRTGRQARQRNFAQLNTLHVESAVQQPPGSPADLNGRDRKPRALVIAHDDVPRTQALARKSTPLNSSH